MKKMDEIIVEFIADYYKKNLFYPNYDEIAEGVGRAKTTVHSHMKRLEREGIIIRKSDYSYQYRMSQGLVLEGGQIRDGKNQLENC